tara:strand:+ start:31670 stop:32767 length:1098 start_codon:yes stop_codon:yes gene_type:complete
LKLAQSIYIHFPFCRHRCNYCDFFKQVPTNNEKDFNSFEKLFLESFNQNQIFLTDNNYRLDQLKTVYIGGGTPSLWGKRGATLLKDLFDKNSINLQADCEFTLEVNPGSWTKDDLLAWRSSGVNRFSLGVQSLDSRFIKILDRVHNLDEALRTIEFFSNEDWNFSVDFMLGLPYSEEWNRDIYKELDVILSYRPKHLSLYILTVKDNYPHYEKLPSEDYIANEFLGVSKKLREAGYEHYEVSNFSLKDKESKHNLRYWESETVAALGPSATGFLSESKKRYKWKTKSAEFEVENLSLEEFKLEEVYMLLRTNRIISRSEVMIADELLQKWSELSYVVLHSKDEFQVLPDGFLMLDSMMDDIFRYR